MQVLDRRRPIIAAQAVGIAQGALNLADSHLKLRHGPGKPLAEQEDQIYEGTSQIQRTVITRRLLQ